MWSACANPTSNPRRGKFLSASAASSVLAWHVLVGKAVLSLHPKSSDRIRHTLVPMANHDRACGYTVNAVKRLAPARTRGSR